MGSLHRVSNGGKLKTKTNIENGGSAAFFIVPTKSRFEVRKPKAGF
jgi:hypothetical protein